MFQGVGQTTQLLQILSQLKPIASFLGGMATDNFLIFGVILEMQAIMNSITLSILSFILPSSPPTQISLPFITIISMQLGPSMIAWAAMANL